VPQPPSLGQKVVDHREETGEVLVVEGKIERSSHLAELHHRQPRH